MESSLPAFQRIVITSDRAVVSFFSESTLTEETVRHPLNNKHAVETETSSVRVNEHPVASSVPLRLLLSRLLSSLPLSK